MMRKVDAQSLSGRLEAAMHDAMRAREPLRTSTLRMAVAAVRNQEIARGRSLTDDEVVDVLGTQVKQRRESIAAYRDGGRDDRAETEEAEAAILAEFLPEQLGEAEIEARVRDAIAETGATSPADIGRVMGRLMPQTRGRADGRVVSEVVRRLLAGR